MYTVELNGHEAKVDFDNGYEEFSLYVQFDYQPYEKSTSDYPGASEAVEFYDCTRDGSYADICLLGDTHEYIEEAILNAIHDYRQAEYDAYMQNDPRGLLGHIAGASVFTATLLYVIFQGGYHE